MQTFFSYSPEYAEIVYLVRLFAQSSLGKVFTYKDDQQAGQNYLGKFVTELGASENLVIFVGERVGEHQVYEVEKYRTWMLQGNTVKGREGVELARKAMVVGLCDREHITAHLAADGRLKVVGDLETLTVTVTDQKDEATALKIAEGIVNVLEVQWRPFDDLPQDPHLFSYEKHIIDHFHTVQRLFPDGFDPDRARTRGTSTDVADMAAAATIKTKWLTGCPVKWPDVTRFTHPRHPYCRPPKESRPVYHDNLLPEAEIGRFRPPEAKVVVKALTEAGANGITEFSFSEAGPRRDLFYPVRSAPGLNVGIIVSGGIAPGVNAVIDGIVQRHWQYALRHGYVGDLRIYGYQDGFLSFKRREGAVRLAPDDPEHAEPAGVVFTAKRAHEGGSIVGTSRVDALLASPSRAGSMREVSDRLREIDILYIIGGDGTMKAAHALYHISHQNRDSPRGPLSVVAIPKTMDNDVLWVWQSFGFLSAVEKAREVIEHLNTEVQSNPRLCVVQLFGSDSGFVVSHAVLAGATGHCVAALIPEVRFSMAGLIAYLQKRIRIADDRPPHGIVVMAETAIPTDAMLYVNAKPPNPGEAPSPYYIGLSEEEKAQIIKFEGLRADGKRIQGQTHDALRSAGLKIVSRGLENHLKMDDEGNIKVGWDLLRVFTNEPRHLLRAIPPSCLDIIVGQRLGTLAVDNALAGYTDFMISQWLTEYVLVPLKLAVLGRKRIPEDGMFWKSVLAKTGQPADLEKVPARARAESV